MGFVDISKASDAMEAIRKLFSPEFRNRLDAIIQFGALDQQTILRVVEKFLMQLEHQLHERNVQMSVDEAARHWLAERGFDPQMGARPMARVIQDQVKRRLADELLFGKLVDGGRVLITVKDDDLHVEIDALPEPIPPALEAEPA
jgi:ATP-dependent Clp protease ATP-binding subunit ClpA